MAVNTAVDDANASNRGLDAGDARSTYHQDYNYNVVA